MSITLKAGEAYLAEAASGYPNFETTLRLPNGSLETVKFVGSQFVTRDSDIATALQKEVEASGCPWLVKGAVVTEKELDPLNALREKIIKEESDRIRAAAAEGSTYDNTNTGAGMVTSAVIAKSGNMDTSATAGAAEAAIKAAAAKSK